MREKTSVLLNVSIISFMILFQSCQNFSVNENKDENIHSILYTHKIDSFLTHLYSTYGDSAKDSIWRHLDALQSDLIGARFDDFLFKDVHGEQFSLYQIKEPIVFEVTASWCAPCKASVPALNDLAEKYDKRVQFIFLTHDDQKSVGEFAAGINSKIIIVPSEELLDIMQPVKTSSGGFKQIFPFPSAYFLDEDKIITKIKTGGPIVGKFPQPDGKDTIIYTKQDVYNINIKIFSTEIEKILQKQ